jgi:iron complex outermembrane receptor protein
MTEKVEILRGPSSVLYGSNAMGGVINIVTKKALEDGYKGSATVSAGSYGTVQAENTNLIRSGKFSAIANINYQRTDGHRPNSDFEQVAGFLKLGYDFSNNWKASADIDLTHFNFMNPGPTTAPLLDAEAKITRGLASVSVSNAYGKTNGTIRAFYDWGHHNVDDGHTADKPTRDYLYKHDDFIGGVTAFQNFQFFTGNNTTFGFDYQHFGGDAWQMLKSNGSHKSDYNTENQDDIAGYIDIRQAITGLVTLDFGLRVDHHSQVGTEIVPQGGIVFHFTKTQDVKLLVSKGFANPVIRDMYMFPPHNEKLEPERMINYELAYFKRATNGTFGANIFIVDGKNMISTAPNPSGAGMLNQNVGDFHNYGFEVEGDYTFGRWWTINANYSYLHMKKPVTGAPEGKLYLGATYRHGSWNANVNIENISGLYITTGDDPEKENYTTLNCSLGYNVSQNVRLFVRANNIFAERYETYAGFPMPKATFMGGVKVDFGN